MATNHKVRGSNPLRRARQEAAFQIVRKFEMPVFFISDRQIVLAMRVWRINGGVVSMQTLTEREKALLQKIIEDKENICLPMLA